MVELKEMIEELQELALEPGEEEHLLEETKRLSGAEKLIQLLSDSKSRLSEDELSLMEQMEILRKNIQQSSEMDPDCVPLMEELEQCFFQLEDFGRALQKRQEIVEINPERLSFLNDRLNRVQRLQRKYALGHSDELCELLNSSEKEHTDLINLEENSQLLEEQFETALTELKQAQMNFLHEGIKFQQILTVRLSNSFNSWVWKKRDSRQDSKIRMLKMKRNGVKRESIRSNSCFQSIQGKT